MTPSFLFGLMFIAAVWGFGGYLIWEFGPGERIRSVWCPVLKKRATILGEQKEAGFRGSYAGLTVVDVKECTLVHESMVACHKECIQPVAHGA